MTPPFVNRRGIGLARAKSLSRFATEIPATGTNYLTITNGASPNLQLLGLQSHMVWWCPNTIPAGAELRTFYQTWASPTQRSFIWRISASGPSVLMDAFFSSNGTATEARIQWDITAFVSIALYRHYAIVVDPTQQIQSMATLYIDTVSQGNGTVVTGTPTNILGALHATTEDRLLGGTPGGVSTVVDGFLDEQAALSVALTQPQIASFWKSIIPSVTVGLQGYWRYENNLLDGSPNGYTLAGVGAGIPIFSMKTPF